MIKKNEGCIGCSDGCLRGCRNYEVIYLVCDECDQTVDDLYLFDGEQICEECLLNKFEKVEV